MYEQLALDLNFKSPEEPLNELSLENYLGVKTNQIFNFNQDKSIFENIHNLTTFIYQNKGWSMEDLVTSIRNLATYYDFQFKKSDIDKVESKSWKDSLMNEYVHDKEELLFEIKLKKSAKYHFYLVVVDDNNLSSHGGVRKFNLEGKDDEVRFVVQNFSEIIGYSQIISSINRYYQSKRSETGFSRKVLNNQLRKIIDGNYNAELISNSSTITQILDPWLGTPGVKKRVKFTDERIYPFLTSYLKFIYNLALQNSRLSQLEIISNQLGTKTRSIKIKSQLKDYFLKIISTGQIDEELFSRFQNDLLNYLPILPLGTKKPTLELTSFQEKKIFSLYLPNENKIVIDFPHGHQLAAFGEAGCRSFLHAYGNYLDYQYQDKQKSFQNSFSDILNEYQSKISESDPKYHESAYLSPNEVFATALEVFAKEKGIDCLLTKRQADFAYKVEYEVFDKQLINMVNTYFETEFPNSFRRIQIKKQVVTE